MARPGRTMIITQTPLRVGLLGGGTDRPEYYREYGGRGAQLPVKLDRLGWRVVLNVTRDIWG